MAVNYLLQCLRVRLCPTIKHKVRYFWKCQLNYFPNYVMAGIVIYTSVESHLLKETSASIIVLLQARLLFQISVYTLVTT